MKIVFLFIFIIIILLLLQFVFVLFYSFKGFAVGDKGVLGLVKRLAEICYHETTI